jgi:uncharacterized protein YqeY
MLKETIKSDLKIAMKSGDKNKTQVLRMLLSEITYGETTAQTYTAEKAVQRYFKKLQEAKLSFTEDAGKKAIDGEISVVEAYLPKQTTLLEIEVFIKTLDLSQSFGDLMKTAVAKFPNDGKTISGIIKSLQQK